MTTGRLTLPVQTGIDEELGKLITRLKADAVRNSDGTELPAIAAELADKVYETYFCARGDQEWAVSHPDQTTRMYLLSRPVTAGADPKSGGPLAIDIMDGYYQFQVAPDTACDVTRYWQVTDRTTGEHLVPDEWELTVEKDNSVAEYLTGFSAADPRRFKSVVAVKDPVLGHVYTVSFLAHQMWDSTQMYNYITNNWWDDETRHKEQPYDVRYDETWKHVQEGLDHWLATHPHVDVVRFTTFFYHFTLVFNDEAKEKFVDWFGYSASVSVPAMEAFEKEYGYALTPEDFVDEGSYNNPFRVPTKHFLDWMDFQQRFVADRVKTLVDQTHAAGKEAMMFLGDNWIGTEPYGKYFAGIGMDAVVGSVGSGATCRMISDIPGVRYTEGRFLPYFFPDVFHPGGDPVGEADEFWLLSRRAIVRSPLDRIGYGGYLSLALEFPEFVDRVEGICDEFRSIHEHAEGEAPDTCGLSVGILNAWGSLRSWQTHMVAHAKRYKHTYSYVGVLEALSGLPVDVKFLSFDDIKDGVPEGIDVLINVGGAGTAFSGGSAAWGQKSTVPEVVRSFVARGGGLIGVGEPTARVAEGTGRFFELADVFGVDKEVGFTLSEDRYYNLDGHFVTADIPVVDGKVIFHPGERPGDIVVTGKDVIVLADKDESVDVAVNSFGKGRAVYCSGLAYSVTNARLLFRALCWAAGKEEAFDESWITSDDRLEAAAWKDKNLLLVMNNSLDHVTGTVSRHGVTHMVDLDPCGYIWMTWDGTPA